MAHDVFISHARKDMKVALTICDKLESSQLKCWIAERDISTGEDWTEATRKAIASSKVMVLVLSDNANAAPHIEREMAHAFYTKRAIFPVRLTETPPQRDFLFYLGNVRWFDAFNSSPEKYLEELATSINGIVHGHTVTRESKIPALMTSEARKTLEYSDSWMGALRASHYGALEILKRITIAASLLAAVWLLWFVYSQMKNGAFFQEDDAQAGNTARGTVPTLTPKATPESSPPKSNYTYSRFGLWVPPNSSPTASPEERSSPVQAAAVSVPSTAPTPTPGADQKADDQKADDQKVPEEKTAEQNEGAGDNDTNALKSLPQDSSGTAQADPTVQLVVDPSPTPTATPTPTPTPTPTNEPATEEPEAMKTAEAEQSPSAVPLASPSVAPMGEKPAPETQSSRSLPASSEQESLKELVTEYLRTMASDDDSIQERFFAGRVHFYDKGVLSFPEIETSMERYRRQWPVRKWEPKGEPEFPNTLHTSNPDLYEVLQPFDWTVSNGPKHKEGSAALYVRIRKAPNGDFHIFHLEQRPR
jgi:hypothetical protein